MSASFRFRNKLNLNLNLYLRVAFGFDGQTTELNVIQENSTIAIPASAATVFPFPLSVIFIILCYSVTPVNIYL